MSVELLGDALPVEMTRFFGRTRELAEIDGLLTSSRLVTLTGVAGVGKTRLALRAATTVQRAFQDGVVAVEVSTVRDGDLLAHVIAGMLQVRDRPDQPIAEVVAAHLAERHLLLVLDTCDPHVDACARLVAMLLERAPGLVVLATSRQPLGIAGERVVPVAPLCAGIGEDPGAASGAAAGNAAVRLFADRAALARPGFALTPRNEHTVAEVCRRVDGIPLAIELAAARVRALSVEQLVARLEDPFALLSSRSATAPPRHRALRAAIGWSHELCEPGERLLWARLSILPGEFDAATAAIVCADAHLPAARIPALLEQLVDKSIVAAERGPTSTVYRMLSTVRAFGREWLDALGEEPQLRRRHAERCVDVAE